MKNTIQPSALLSIRCTDKNKQNKLRQYAFACILKLKVILLARFFNNFALTYFKNAPAITINIHAFFLKVVALLILH